MTYSERIQEFFAPNESETVSRENIIRISLRKLVFYIIFLTLATMIAFGKSSRLGYVFTRTLKNEFINAEFPAAKDTYLTFNKISTASDFWDVSFTCIGLALFRGHEVVQIIKILEKNHQTYLTFDGVGFMQTLLNNAIAITLFLIWVKIFKYINVSRTMGQLSTTLSKCSTDIFGFSIMFFVIFLAFAQVGHLLFGTQVRDFSTFGSSILTLLMTILGDFDYEEIEQTNRVLAPVFFVTYIFLVFFVLFNMFLAIIMDTYSGVTADLRKRCTELSVKEFLERGPRKIYGRLRPGTIKEDVKVHNDTIWKLQTILKMCGFPEVEIKIFFSKYGISEDSVIDDEKAKQFRKELKEKIKKDKHIIQDLPDIRTSKAVTNETFKSFQEQVEKLMNELEDIESEISTLIKMKQE